jgi:sugar phosphate isomerase/epimerase
MRIGIADYGLNVWDGGNFDPEERWLALQTIGYEGIERIYAANEADAMHQAARIRRCGFGFATCRGPDTRTSIQWSAALDKEYVWVEVNGRDFSTFCRQVNRQVAICAPWGLKVGLHNHLGSLVETEEQVEAFLKACPGCWLILDTAHLAAADGDTIKIAKKYARRIVAVHVKDWLVTSPEVGLDQWSKRGRFCELGAGNIDLDNGAVLKALAKAGYDGWVFVEHDTHLRDCYEDLAVSREYLRKAGA